MTRQALLTRLPWQDRWTEPTAEQLLGSLKSQHEKLFRSLIESVTALSNLKQNVIWYGPAWKWTIHLSVTDDRGQEIDSMCYLVPNREAPLVCVPLSERVIEHLPMKRLKKFVREGIRGGRFAVAIHWATWTVNSQSEVASIMDLIKRKHKLMMTPPEAVLPQAKAG